MLSIEAVKAGYGDVGVLHGVSLDVQEGEIVALIGSNGAGKTTLLKTVSGLLTVSDGEIRHRGEPITSLKTFQRVQRGIALVPEGRRLFGGMTVLQNLMMGAFQRSDASAVDADLQRVYRLFPQLKERQQQLAGAMSGGEQQMCAIGRGLMAAPQLLLVDELSLGLAPVAVDALLDALKEIQQQGTTLLVVEQDVRTALSVADRGYVIQTGQIRITAPSAELLANSEVQAAYLGI